MGKEGSGNTLGKDRAYHCDKCTHVPTGRRLALGLAGAGATLISLIVVWLSLLAGLALVLVGGILAAGAYLEIRRSAAQARIPVPLRPKADQLRLVEKLRARITLGPQGAYKTELFPVDGELTVILVFGRPDRERVERQLRRRPRPSSRDIQFSAGRLVLQGRVGIRQVPEFPGPILALEGSTGSYPVFRTEDPHVSSTWNINLSYRLSAEPDISSGPVWITPSIVPGTDRRALELEIQWLEVGSDDEPLSLEIIELLQLGYPVSWGNVEQVSERAILGILPGDPDGYQMVEWRQLSPAEQDRRERRLTLAIRFENRIDLQDVLRGRLEVTMKGTLSGVDGVRLYGSLGASRNFSSGISIRTRIEADFQLSLASIRYQAVRIVPDRRAEDSGSGYADEFSVIPDDETIIELTNAMSEQGYYVKRVIENPPRSGGRANLVQRYWDIAGRRYEGVYPIDFHIVLTGEEVHRGGIRPEDGTTKVRLTVQGAYTDTEMYDRIEQEWKALRALTADTLTVQAAAVRRPGSGARTSRGGTPQESSDPELMADPEPHLSRGSRLQRRLSKLDEALLDERISQQQYTEMRRRAEREFGDG